MNAVEIVKEFHALDDAGREAALADTTKGLGREIAASPSAQAAIAQDFDSSGKLTAKGELSPDERVALTLPSHPFRSGASIPEGIKLDAAGLATEVAVPAADAAFQASASGLADTSADRIKPEASLKSLRPQAEVGDKVKVGDKDGEIVAVEGGVATKIQMADGAEVTDVNYTYADAKKAKADKEWQEKK